MTKPDFATIRSLAHLAEVPERICTATDCGLALIPKRTWAKANQRQRDLYRSYGCGLIGTQTLCNRCVQRRKAARKPKVRTVPDFIGEAIAHLTTLKSQRTESKDGWDREAACLSADLDPDTFFPSGQHSPQALETCAACPVRMACLDRALAARERHGLWAGLSAHQLKQVGKMASSLAPEYAVV